MPAPPRLFFAGMPTPEEAAQWHARLADAGVIGSLGPRLFAPSNWHQSLSDSFGPEARGRLLRAGDAFAGTAVAPCFNRVAWAATPQQRIHCTLHARGRPAGFDAVLARVRAALAGEGLDTAGMPRAHVTLSYAAATQQPSIAIVPILWTLRELVLLAGHGRPYRYDVLGRWPLQPAARPTHQHDLFAPA